MTRFGPYELVHRLGAGGMAETFLAVRRGPGAFEQHVCVKRILPAYESDPELVRQFLEEARLAAQLRHANITQVIEFGEVAGSHYLALELVDGLDLRTVLRPSGERGPPLGATVVVHLALELSAALEAAHTPGRGRPAIIHRDVSPSNVLVSRQGEVYLTDFGIARALGAERRTDSGVVRGKVPYMAPEYAMHARYDARTDLFGLGVTLFEALAGQRPYDGRTELETLTRIKDGTHPPLASLAAHAPAPLVAIVEQLIRPDPDHRFASAHALVEALSPLAPPPTVSRQLAELVRASTPDMSHSMRLSSASRTAALAPAPAPSYPDVDSSSPGDITRTSQPSSKIDQSTNGLWSATDPGRSSVPGGWASTDPGGVIHHDDGAPLPIPTGTPASIPTTLSSEPIPGQRASTPSVDERASAPSVDERASIPSTHVALPVPAELEAAFAAPKPRRPLLWAVVIVLGLLAFVGASAAAYLLVVTVQG